MGAGIEIEFSQRGNKLKKIIKSCLYRLFHSYQNYSKVMLNCVPNLFLFKLQVGKGLLLQYFSCHLQVGKEW